MSISGLFKKFKHRVSADDVIYLRGAELDRTGYDSEFRGTVVPSPDDLTKIIIKTDEKNLKPYIKILDVWTDLDTRFSKITKSKKLQNDEVAKSFRDLWTKFKKDHGGKASGVKDFDDYYKFVEDYDAAYSKEKSMSEDVNLNISDILDMLFENGSISNGVLAALREADDATANSGGDAKPEDAKQAADASTANSGEAAKEAAKPAEEKTAEKAAASVSNNDADGSEGEESAPGQKPDGDDLYIIPMPGVKLDSTDEEGFSGTL